MRYRRFPGRIPGPVEGPLGGFLDEILSPFRSPVDPGIKAAREMESRSVWQETIARIQAGQEIPPGELPPEPPPPDLAPQVPESIRAQYPGFLERHGKALAIAGGLIFGYYYLKGRKKKK